MEHLKSKGDPWHQSDNKELGRSSMEENPSTRKCSLHHSLQLANKNQASGFVMHVSGTRHIHHKYKPNPL